MYWSDHSQMGYFDWFLAPPPSPSDQILFLRINRALCLISSSLSHTLGWFNCTKITHIYFESRFLLILPLLMSPPNMEYTGWLNKKLFNQKFFLIQFSTLKTNLCLVFSCDVRFGSYEPSKFQVIRRFFFFNKNLHSTLREHPAKTCSPIRLKVFHQFPITWDRLIPGEKNIGSYVL